MSVRGRLRLFNTIRGNTTLQKHLPNTISGWELPFSFPLFVTVFVITSLNYEWASTHLTYLCGHFFVCRRETWLLGNEGSFLSGVQLFISVRDRPQWFYETPGNMMISSHGNIFRVTGPLWGESTGHRWIPLTRPASQSIGGCFDLRLNKRLSKQSGRRWFETPSRSLWYHCNDLRRLSKDTPWLDADAADIWPVSHISSHKVCTRFHYSDVITGAMTSQITSLVILYSTVYSGADQRKHQSSASLAFVWGIHQSPMNSPHKWPVKRKMFPFDDVIVFVVLCFVVVALPILGGIA